MTTVADAPPPAAAPTPAGSRGWKWVAGLAALIAVVALSVAVFAFNRDDNGTNTTQNLAAQRIAATQTACQQWLANNAPNTTPNPSWCTGMTGWMSSQMASGHMMNGTAWSTPQGMIDACRQWATTSGTAATSQDPTAWCQQMVAWMTQYMGGWHDSGDWDNHMGGWGNGMMGR